MRAGRRYPPWANAALVVGVLLAWLTLAPAVGDAQTAQQRLDAAQARQLQIQARLDAITQRLYRLRAAEEQGEGHVAALLEQHARQQRIAAREHHLVAEHARRRYMNRADDRLAVLDTDSLTRATEQARLLGLLRHRQLEQFEQAVALSVRTRGLAHQLVDAAQALERQRDQLQEAQTEAGALIKDAVVQVNSEKGSTAPAPTIRAGRACPLGSPRHFSDTWGAPRSGGRRHQGVDMFAPRHTALYAFENGVVLRAYVDRIGGRSIKLRGASGTEYYYTHLQGWAKGLRNGSRVTLGEHIGYNGNDGNARFTPPHVHFEIRPGGGAKVNPYPHVRRACA